MNDFNGLTFKGAAKPLDDIDLPKLGNRIGVGEDELHAFMDVETRGTGFDSEGRPRILFERHIFWKYLPKEKRANAPRDLANSQSGGYGAESAQYGRLKRALKIDRRAALFACSWGLGQVMGFNHKAAGYADIDSMILAFMDDEEAHLEAAVQFIITNRLDDELRRHDWAGFAKGYNGPAYRKNRYDTKLAEAFRKWSRIKDTPWQPEPVTSKPAPPSDPLPEPEPDNSGPRGLMAVLVAIIGMISKLFERKTT